MQIFDDFKFEEKAPQSLIEKYREKVPEELLEVWEEKGFGSILDGYLKFINPESFQDLMYGSYFRGNVSIPIFATGMGDLITWEENRYLRLINYRKGRFKGISAGFEFFFSDFEDRSFCEKYLDWNPYTDAVEKYGKPKFDECFGYVLLLGLGGVEKVENLKKVKLIEYIYLIIQFLGPIE
ncbi:T6SS immunity protein Tdi1 domain-containing protein [Fictibacillus sp. Mic-4]|uniref:T6SS immunity protein Tdi1 domain-containing protein n=1 Tax=Fictibacillus TaxID=1329200 RepID=UPI000401FCA5|nr:T6SS immunity protein Tdi1 domain-containing protein [Fictibacillus gelatini]